MDEFVQWSAISNIRDILEKSYSRQIRNSVGLSFENDSPSLVR